jgi:hypothetical protein
MVLLADAANRGQIIEAVISSLSLFKGRRTLGRIRPLFHGTAAMRKQMGSLSDAIRGSESAKILTVGGTGLLPPRLGER